MKISATGKCKASEAGQCDKWGIEGWFAVGVSKKSEGKSLGEYSNWPDNENHDYGNSKEKIRENIALEALLG